MIYHYGYLNHSIDKYHERGDITHRPIDFLLSVDLMCCLCKLGGVQPLNQHNEHATYECAKEP